MPADWVARPRLNPAEQALFLEFQHFARFCGHDPRPGDAMAWFQLREIDRAEWPWLVEIFGAMAQVTRERIADD